MLSIRMLSSGKYREALLYEQRYLAALRGESTEPGGGGAGGGGSNKTI